MAVAAPLLATVSYLQAGDPQGARVILVHGTPGAATAWADYVLAPPAGVHLLALDRPGFGRSGPDGPVTGLAEQAGEPAPLFPRKDLVTK